MSLKCTDQSPLVAMGLLGGILYFVEIYETWQNLASEVLVVWAIRVAIVLASRLSDGVLG